MNKNDKINGNNSKRGTIKNNNKRGNKTISSKSIHDVNTPSKTVRKKQRVCIAVTGACGFLGSVIVRQLIAQHHTVRALRHKKDKSVIHNDDAITIIDGDICNKADMEKLCEGADALIHTASFVSIVGYKNKLLAETNIEGTKQILEVCKKLKIKKLVYIGSVEAMGKIHEGIHDEREGFHPEYALIPYGATKAVASQIVYDFGKAYKKEHDCSVSIVSPGGIIGPFDEGESDIGKMVQMYLKKKLIAYPSKGGFCFVDVRDVAATAIALSRNREDSEYYLAAGNYLSVRDMMNMLQEVSHIRKPLFTIPLWLMYIVGGLFELLSKYFKTRPTFTIGSVKVLSSCLQVSSKKITEKLEIQLRPAKESFKDQVQCYKSGEAPLI